MTTREILDSLSDALSCDERILSPPERALLADLLRHTAHRADTHSPAVNRAITQALGEVIAERAYGVLGHHAAQRIVEQACNLALPATFGTPPRPQGPQPPGPDPPGPKAVMQPRHSTLGTPPRPQGPQPPGPDPPGPKAIFTSQAQTSAAALLEVPELLPARCVVLDEFLAPQELHALLQFTMAREIEFRISEVVSPGVAAGNVDFTHRRSRVLEELGPHRQVILDRIQTAFPGILRKLDLDPFPIRRVEAQITASNDGDFFHWHTDNSQDPICSRHVTFVYFFHQEPRQFRGGELRIHDSRWENGGYVPAGNFHVIVPAQNQMVLFASSLAHEITQVECPSRAFAHSRFTVNGWFHR